MAGGRREEGDVVSSFLVYGFLVWLVATVGFRLFGGVVLVPEGGVRLVVLFIVTVPGVAALMYGLYARKGLDERDRVLAAVCAVLPGMVLDVFALAFFGAVYPNMQSTAAPLFGSFVLWAYALVLLTGFLPVRVGRRTAA